MEHIKLKLTDEELEEINGGVMIEKSLVVNNTPVLMSIGCVGGKDNPGGNNGLLSSSKTK